MSIKKLKKSVSVLTTITTAVTMSGVAMLAPLAVMAADVIDGDIVSPDAEFTEDGTVYYPYDVFIVKMINGKTFKRLVLNPQVFDSYGHLEWGNIETISASMVDGYVTSNLVRADGDAKVYELTPDGDSGTKTWLDMTAAAFGASYDWDAIYTINNTDRDAYTTGNGSVVTSDGTLTVSLAANTPASSIVVKSAARYPFTKVNLTASGGDVVVDSMTIERGGLAQDGAFSSVAVIQDTEDGDQLGNNKSFNASHNTTLNDDLTIKSGTTKSIYLSGNMASNQDSYAGEAPTLGLTAITLKGDASLNASFPIVGNAHTINNTISIGTATIVEGSTITASNQKVGVENYVVSSIRISGNSAEAMTVKKLTFTQQGSAGTSDVANIDLVNSGTGEVLQTIASPGSKTLTFDVNSVIAKGKNIVYDLRLDIIDGSGRTISYDVDENTDVLVKGDTYGYYITPTYTGVSARPYYNPADTTIADGTLRVESVAVSPTTIAEDTTDVLLGKFKFVAKGEDVKLTSVGWEIRIATSTQAGGTLMTDITNLTIYDESGNAIAGPMDPSMDSSGATVDGSVNIFGAATTTDTFIVPVGETTYTVKGDLSGDFSTNDTIRLSLTPNNMTARGMTTDNAITPTPGSQVASTVLTVKAAALTITVTSDPTAQTIVAGAQNFTLANYLFDATNSGSDIDVRQVLVPIQTTGASYPAIVSGLQLFDGSTEIDVNTYSEATWNSTAAGSGTTTLTLSAGALVIPAGTTKLISVVGDLGTGATGGSIKIGLQDQGVSANDESGNTVSETATAAPGSVMSLSAGGTLNVSALTDPASGLVVAGTEGVTVGKFTMQAKYEDMNINYLGLALAQSAGGIKGSNDEISSVSLYEDGVATALGTVSVVGANATITPSTTLTIPIGTTKSYSLKANFATIQDGSPASSGSGIRFSVSNVDVTGASAGSSSVTVNGTDDNFSNFAPYKSLPTVTKLAFSGNNIITGNSEVSLYKFKVAADAAGPLSLVKFTFGLTTTTVIIINDVGTLANTSGFFLYVSDSEGSLGSIVSRGSATAEQDMVGAGTLSNGYQLETFFDVNDDDSSGKAQEQLIINAGDVKYFTLRGTVSALHDGTVDNESISTVMAGDSGFAATTVLSAGGPGATDGVMGKDQNDFIWSDLNADRYASSTATRTAMYFNGYRIPGLGSTSSTPQTITD